MPLYILHGDITKTVCDAVVNAANSSLAMGGGVCGAIFSAAGARELARECGRLGYCAPGQAVITGGYALPARHIIHTVGPVWRGGGCGEEKTLRSCYKSVLELAKGRDLSSVAFPLISSGIFGYPLRAAFETAVSEIETFLAAEPMEVYLVLFGSGTGELEQEYADKHKTSGAPAKGAF